MDKDRKSTRLNSSHTVISYAVFCLIRTPPPSPLFPYTTLFRSRPSRSRDIEAREMPLVPNCSAESQSRIVSIESKHRKRVSVQFPTSPSTRPTMALARGTVNGQRSEEHTSELQSHSDLVCRLLLDTHPTAISTLSLHDALPISPFALA